ncbi:MAG: DEAD/DEAH box helicase family protein [Bacteroidales bacterium]|nr:DEAD/DEAH box helicase family protein [Bacteroidales bacterium]
MGRTMMFEDEEFCNDETEEKRDLSFPEFERDNWAQELKTHMQGAMQIWVASAYVDIRAVDMLRDTMNSLPRDKHRTLRFLFDKEFHEHPKVREVIINKILELPNTEVRIADTVGKFHPKCYIFDSGSYTSCLVGSMNFTKCGLERNTELGIVLEEEKNVTQCKDFFKEHWQKGIKQEKTGLAQVAKQKFKEKDQVLHIQTERIGLIINVDLKATPYKYDVYFGYNNIGVYPEDEIELVEKYKLSPANIRSFSKLTKDIKTFPEYIFAYLYERYLLPARDGHYAAYTSRIDELWYQKIPLMKIVNQKNPRLLIADEVGLGKTIEAGLIIKEYMRRMLMCNRIIIICPNNLLQKWQTEMILKFGISFKIYRGNNLNHLLHSFDKEKNIRALISYESIGREEYVSLLQVSPIKPDFLVCDEAHYLRNNNLRQKAIRPIASHVRCFIMLTATPINLSNQELQTLLGILDPIEYENLDDNKWQNIIICNSYISRLYHEIEKSVSNLGSDETEIKITNDVIIAIKNLEDHVLNTTLLGSKFKENHPLRELINIIKQLNKENKSINLNEMRNLQDKIIQSNLLWQSITRTMKKDVQEFNVRDIKTMTVKLREKWEKTVYSRIVNAIKKSHSKKKHESLKLYSILRQASSCLPMLDVDKKLSDLILEGQNSDADDESNENNEKYTADLLKNITKIDSKYGILKGIIEAAKIEDPDYKIIIFCMFHRTIDYLKLRINSEYGEDTAREVTGRTLPLEKRYKEIDDFRNSKERHILICSEVASEGIDLQFCHIIVNYDLPWNPTKVEQRIGRIDRYGQQAEKIKIFNLVVEGSVEEIIYITLETRMEDIRNTLGPVADVLGRIEREIPEKLLNADFTIDEKIKYEKELKSILNKEVNKEKKSAISNLSLLSNTEKQLSQSIYLIIEDNVELIPHFLRDNLPHGILFVENQGKLNISMTSDFKEVFFRYLNNMEMSDYALHINRLLTENGGLLPVVLTREKALQSNYEFLTIDHPLVSFLIELGRKGKKVISDTICHVRSIDESIPQGKYILAEYIFETNLNGIRYSSRFNRQAFKISANKIERVNEENLVKRLYNFNNWCNSSNTLLPDDILDKIEEDARNNAEQEMSSNFTKMETMLSETKKMSIIAIEEQYEKEKSVMKERLESTVDPNERNIILQHLDDIKKDIHNKIDKIPDVEDLRCSPKLLVIIDLEKE